MAVRKNYREIKENPALSYITQISGITDIKDDEPQKSVESPIENVLKEASSLEISSTPEGYKIKPQYTEIKTRRVQLIFPPSLFRKAQARAKRLNLSLNEFICLMLDAILHNDPDPEK